VSQNVWGWVSGEFAQDALRSIDDLALEGTVGLLVAMQLRRALTPFAALVAASAGLFAMDELEAVHALHAAISVVGYPSFMLRGTETAINPQNALVLGFPILVLALAARCLLPGGRSFDRIAVVVLGLSVGTTGVLFHVMTVSSIMEDRNREMDFLRAVASQPDVRPACRAHRLLCTFADAGPPPGVGIEGVDASAASVAAAAGEHPTQDFLHAWGGTAGVDVSVAKNYVAAVSRIGDGETRLLVSLERPSARFEFENTRFSIEAGAAHATWLLLTLSVCFLHSPRRRARRAMAALSPAAVEPAPPAA
jgi:hypothetical protein